MNSLGRDYRIPAEAGFSLLELIIVIVILVILAAFAVSQLVTPGQGDRFIQQAAARVRERHSAAIRLNPLQAATSLESYVQPPLVIDFQATATTAALSLEGSSVTQFSPTTGMWNYVYQGTPLSPPPGWRLATTPAQLLPVPPITGNRASLATQVGFLADGTVSPAPPSQVSPGEAPFWAIYWTNGIEARALAVHRTGAVEVWRYNPDKGAWTGYGGRN
ncbi:MAG: prepilin-type N-terminal cleavage/methylation domain-containing protein [Blastocatellia bacterium]